MYVHIQPNIMYNIHMQPVGQALIYALSKACKEKFTTEVQDAWLALYSVVQYYMTLGMTEGLDA